MKNLLVFFCCLFINSTTIAKSSSPLSLINENFNEKFNSNVPVSGRVISGVMQSSKSVLSNIKVNLTNLNTNIICLKVQSRDGTYFSSNEYRVNEKAKGLITPEYPTKYEEVLTSFSDNELAILAFEGECSDRKLNNVLISSRHNTTNDKVIVYVSSGRSDVFINTIMPKGKKKTTKCMRIENGKRTAYDTECIIDVKYLLNESNEVSILRRKSGRRLPTVRFNLVYSAL